MVLIATVNFTFDAEAVPNIVTPSTVLQSCVTAIPYKTFLQADTLVRKCTIIIKHLKQRFGAPRTKFNLSFAF